MREDAVEDQHEVEGLDGGEVDDTIISSKLLVNAIKPGHDAATSKSRLGYLQIHRMCSPVLNKSLQRCAAIIEVRRPIVNGCLCQGDEDALTELCRAIAPFFQTN